MRALKACEKFGLDLKAGRDPNMLRSAALYLYGMQTALERDIRSTVRKNHAGFTKDDARILSGICEAILDRLPTQTEIEILVSERHGVHKYWTQLQSLASEFGYTDDPPRRRNRGQ